MIGLSPSKSSRWTNELIIISFLLILYGPLLYHWVWDGWVNKSISIQHEYFSHGMLFCREERRKPSGNLSQDVLRNDIHSKQK